MNNNNSNDDNKGEAIQGTSNVEWSPEEKCLYEVLAPLFIPYGHPSFNLHNWCCKMSQLLGMKKSSDITTSRQIPPTVSYKNDNQNI
uniref:Uncharacterized protein n=1 Tax=Trichobilharzia regenti TaxID=157069 RepID=A0AA85JJS7_TRIRE|nr:unnamed protein product [Trichobilharzia regenti]